MLIFFQSLFWKIHFSSTIKITNYYEKNYINNYVKKKKVQQKLSDKVIKVRCKTKYCGKYIMLNTIENCYNFTSFKNLFFETLGIKAVI